MLMRTWRNCLASLTGWWTSERWVRLHAFWGRGVSLKFLKSISPFFVGPLIPLIWTVGDVSSEFKSHSRFLAWMLPHLLAMYSSDFPLAWHLLTSCWPAFQSSCFIHILALLYLWKYYNCSTCALPTQFFNLGNLVKTENVLVLVNRLCPVWDLKNSRNTWKREIFQKSYSQSTHFLIFILHKTIRFSERWWHRTTLTGRPQYYILFYMQQQCCNMIGQ